MLEGFMAESRIRNRIAELKEYRRNGIHTLSEGEVYDAEKRHRMMEIARIKAVEYPSRAGGGRANRYLGRDGFVQAPVGDAAPKELQKLTGMERSGSGALTSLGGGARKKAPLPLDLTHLPGVELLSKREKELCVNNRLLPVHYLAIKEALMRASANGQVLKRSEVRHMFKVEPIKAVRVFELLLQNGWVKDPKEETN
jgi:transcriptional adapter 2-alpha